MVASSKNLPIRPAATGEPPLESARIDEIPEIVGVSRVQG
jgi:hypothetical protein